MTSRERLAQCPVERHGEWPEPWHAAPVRRIGRILGHCLLVVPAGLGILLACVGGCSSSSGGGGKPILAPPFSQNADSKAEKEALRKAVEKDPFPRAKARSVDLDA